MNTVFRAERLSYEPVMLSTNPYVVRFSNWYDRDARDTMMGTLLDWIDENVIEKGHKNDVVFVARGVAFSREQDAMMFWLRFAD